MGDISVLVDDNYQMVIRNKNDGNVYEQRVSLANLDTNMKNMQIIVDRGDVPHPGFRMPVLKGKPGVEIYENGQKKETKQELEILLSERRQVQLVISALTQAVRSVRGEQ